MTICHCGFIAKALLARFAFDNSDLLSSFWSKIAALRTGDNDSIGEFDAEIRSWRQTAEKGFR